MNTPDFRARTSRTLVYGGSSADTLAMAQLPQCRNPPAASEYFCSNTVCVFHVRVGDPGVQGSGDWCTTDTGITASHRWVDGKRHEVRRAG